MKTHWLLGIVLYLAAVPALAAPPSPWPSQIPRGEVLVLEPPTGSESTGWRFLPADVRWWLSADGQALVETIRVEEITASWAEMVDGVPVITLATIAVKGPMPEPEPQPDPEPLPPPLPKKLTVVLIEETADRTPALGAMLLDPKLHAWFDAAASRRFRPFDDDQVPNDVRKWVELAAGRLPYLILHDETGQVLHEGKAPDTTAAFLALLNRYAPNGQAPPKPSPIVDPCPPGSKCYVPQSRRYLFRRR